MQQNDETRFEDFVGLISGLYKEIQRIKTSEGARLGLKGSDVMCLYYLERSKDGLTGADLARMAGVTRAAVSRTLAHLEEGGYVEVDDSGDAADCPGRREHERGRSHHSRGARYHRQGHGRGAARADVCIAAHDPQHPARDLEPRWR